MTKDIEPIEAAVLNVPDLQTLDKSVTAPEGTCVSLASTVVEER
ncbi:hypothetical protein AB0N07_43105 [Streptomyces sp. NPDC051172]